jgi:hypothetical protein
LDDLVVVEQGPPQPERDLRRVIELASTDPEVEDTVKQGDRLITPSRDLGRLGESFQILDDEWLFGVCRGVLRARLTPTGRPGAPARVGQVCRGDGFHFSSMAHLIGDG